MQLIRRSENVNVGATHVDRDYVYSSAWLPQYDESVRQLASLSFFDFACCEEVANTERFTAEQTRRAPPTAEL